ncbi:MAG: TetR/AcrR family transcriptional regulator [Nitrospira sp.]|nr:TetR/AcrR family transcriptional regulator [Nitrospira sp.]MBA3753058.1 TetR/AcrR family transcriptional regulator [Nitrospira sp.]
MKLHPTKSLPAAGLSMAERIVAAARQHFLTHGFRRVTMDDLARELGISKKTLYASFPSKMALLEAVLVDKFRSVEKDLSGITSTRSPDVLASLRQLLACMQHHTDEIKPPFVRDMRRESPETFHMVEVRRRDVIQRHFGTVLSQGRKAGIIRKDISTGLIMEILLSAVQAIMNPSRILELGLTPTSGYHAIVTVVLEGVITDSGRRKR